MLHKILSIALLICLCRADHHEEDDLIIETTSGKIHGSLHKSLENKTVEEYLGIPYAKPPLGDLRFAPPVPVDHWEGVHETKHFGHDCIQFKRSKNLHGDLASEEVLEGCSEDCLFLNVWVPHPRPEHAAVLVYIHGGRDYEDGSASFPNVNGVNLASEEGIIVVNMNYRLGESGFLFFGVPDAPGNVGLMDQALAMKWVHDNVAKFGGDPDRITLAGESSGSESAGLHMFIPSSHDLFHQVIMLDGAPIAPDACHNRLESLHLANGLAKYVGCSSATEDVPKMLSCLRGKTAVELMNVTLTNTYNIEEFFGPVTDGHYIPDDPLTLLKQGKVDHNINVLLATTHHRGFPVAHYQNEHFTADEASYPGKFGLQKLVDWALNYPFEYVTRAVMHLYTNWEDPSSPAAIRQEVVDFATDYYYVCPTNELAYKLNAYGNKVYLAQINHQSDREEHPVWAGYDEEEILGYIFGLVHPANNHSEADYKFSHVVMDGLGYFIRTGNPSIAGLADWEPYNIGNKHYLNIKKGGKIEHNLRVQQCAFWIKAYPRIESLQKFMAAHQ